LSWGRLASIPSGASVPPVTIGQSIGWTSIPSGAAVPSVTLTPFVPPVPPPSTGGGGSGGGGFVGYVPPLRLDDCIDQIFGKPEQGIIRAFVDESLAKIGVENREEVDALILGRDRCAGVLVVRRHKNDPWTPLTDWLLAQSMRAAQQAEPFDEALPTNPASTCRFQGIG
jgi:hypothetical protein